MLCLPCRMPPVPSGDFAAKMSAARAYYEKMGHDIPWCDALGLSPSTIESYEQGRRGKGLGPVRTARILARASRVAGLPAGWMLSVPGGGAASDVTESRLESIEITLSGLVLAETERHTEVLRELRRLAR